MDKASIRRNARSNRLKMEAASVEKLSRQILKQLMGAADWSLIHSMHIYSAAQVFNEPQTRPVLEFFWKNYPSIQTYVPRLVGRQMETVLVDATTEFDLNMRDIPEPIEAPASTVTDFDIIVVPLLAFDPQLNRIGYGGGFYDRFLKDYPNTPTVGLAYEQDKVEMIQAEDHDVPLAMIATEKALYNRNKTLNERAERYTS